MSKETSVASERNAYVGSRVKETTFREWVVANQIGMNTPTVPDPIQAARNRVEIRAVSQRNAALLFMRTSA
jgi:hypothetical protein